MATFDAYVDDAYADDDEEEKKQSLCLTGKDTYFSPGSAAKGVKRLHEARWNRNYRLRVYRCEFCRNWHVTHRERQPNDGHPIY